MPYDYVSSLPRSRRFYALVIKPFADKTIASFLLIALAPLLSIIILLLLYENNGSIFFTQCRTGLHCKSFHIIKFRTMMPSSSSVVDPSTDKARISSLGGFLRHTSLDELPSLINVLKGDMSLVGPRPLLVSYLNVYSKYHLQRHDVLPGLTGLAQVNGRNHLSWPARFDLDLTYISSISLWVDVWILLKTFQKVTAREGINSQNSTSMPLFTSQSYLDDAN